jgi:subtilase family serine protease
MISLVQVAALTSAIAAGVPNANYHDLGPASSNARVSVALTLSYHKPAQLEQLIALQANPRSPYYHHWLTSQQFDAAFAPSPAEYASALASLRRAGFQVTQTFANRTVIDATGTVAAAERYFDTRIDRVVQLGHGVRYTNITPARIPRDLSGVLYAVTGLHNLDIAGAGGVRGRRTLRASQRLRSLAATAPLLFGPVNTSDGQIGYGPLAFVRGYDFISRHDKSDTGTGRGAAILSTGNFSETDLAAFLKYFKIKRTGPATKRVAAGSAWSDDPTATLEAEGLVGLAPGIALYLYQIGDTGTASGQSITTAFNSVVSDNKVDVVDAPFSQCESSDVTQTKSWDAIAQQGSALGMTFEAPLDEPADWSCNGWNPAPATSPHFTAVGGTELVVTATGAYQTEFPQDGGVYNYYAGGVSTVFPLPSWQQSVPNITAGGRNTPDIAFDASYYTGLAVYYGGTWQSPDNPDYGTELACAILAAAVVQIDQNHDSRLGLLAPTLYALWQANGYQHGGTTYFHEILQPGVAGYNHTTGIGSFDVWNLAKLLGKS